MFLSAKNILTRSLRALCCASMLSAPLAYGAAPGEIDLSGLWRFQLDPMGFDKTPGSELYLAKLTETITLPGTTDEAGKGIKNEASHVDRLSRKFEYCGQAWYQREIDIPADWADDIITLELERCHWATTVYVDGEEIGSSERLSTPNRFTLPRLAPGTHTLTICVDNRLQYPMDQWAHGTTEYTQTNWNGITGDIRLTARPRQSIAGLRATTTTRDLKADIIIANADTVATDALIEIKVLSPEGKTIHQSTQTAMIDGVTDTLTISPKLTEAARPWDEFATPLYTLQATVTANGRTHEASTPFGFRTVEQGKHHVKVNGIDRHLRGVLDCCVFPLTGYPATEPGPWMKIMRTIQDYGFNHIRFHSWCPPEAAFTAADSLGLYLQVELPMWIKDVGRYPDRRDFFEDELMAILDEYGNHPSFILMCNGNENEGDFSVLEDLVIKGRKHDPRHLYSASTARTHVKADQYYTSHVTGNGWITVYEGKPGTDWDRAKESAIDVPVIAHETGQRCMYPNFDEMSKYTGVLEPRNFAVFRERLTRNRMLGQADDFFRASGAHTVLQYKEVNEALLRTPTSGGYQLLGLSDFPGQGSAFVGILDAFWESKGLVEPEKYRESNGDRVILARFPKRIFTPSDTINVKFELYNFGPTALRSGRMEWWLSDDVTGKRVASGRLTHKGVDRATVGALDSVAITLEGIDRAAKYTLHAKLPDGLHNEWDFWVYPPSAGTASPAETRDWNEARKLLAEGRDVLFIPQGDLGRRTHFASHFWNPIMFNWNPMIVGTLIDADHPSLSGFPTSYYADWQWTDVLNNARALDLTEISASLTPVVQSIDTYEVNRKLGIAFEAKAGNGNLYVLCVDPDKNIGSRPASRRLLDSVREYVASDSFAPSARVAIYELDRLFDPHTPDASSSSGSAAIDQLLNQ